MIEVPSTKKVHNTIDETKIIKFFNIEIIPPLLRSKIVFSFSFSRNHPNETKRRRNQLEITAPHHLKRWVLKYDCVAFQYQPSP